MTKIQEENIYDDCHFKNKENASAWHAWAIEEISKHTELQEELFVDRIVYGVSFVRKNAYGIYERVDPRIVPQDEIDSNKYNVVKLPKWGINWKPDFDASKMKETVIETFKDSTGELIEEPENPAFAYINHGHCFSKISREGDAKLIKIEDMTQEDWDNIEVYKKWQQEIAARNPHVDNTNGEWVTGTTLLNTPTELPNLLLSDLDNCPGDIVQF